MVRRRRRAARRCAWRSFSRLEMKCRRRRASCRTPSRWTSLLKRRTSCSESSPSRRVTCSTCVLSHRSAAGRRSVRLRAKPTAHNPSTEGEGGTIPADAARAPDAKNEPKGPTRRPSVAPPGSSCGLPAVPPLRYGSTPIRIEAQGRLRLGRLIVALWRVPPRHSRLSGASDIFSALAGSGHRTGQSLQIVA